MGLVLMGNLGLEEGKENYFGVLETLAEHLEASSFAFFTYLHPRAA